MAEIFLYSTNKSFFFEITSLESTEVNRQLILSKNLYHFFRIRFGSIEFLLACSVYLKQADKLFHEDYEEATEMKV